MTYKNTENSEQHPQVRVDCGVMGNGLSDNWMVSITNIGETIHVMCGKQFIYSPYESIYVDPPNWFERLFGITHRQKIDAAVARVQETCDHKNEADTKGKEIVGIYT